MAMPTRSVRNTGFGEKAPTPVTVGPGSYLRSTVGNKVRPSFTAFASSSRRNWRGPLRDSDSPGPGTYDATSETPNLSKSCPSYSFESKAPRMAPQYTGSTPFGASTVVEVPGPGAYNSHSAVGDELKQPIKPKWQRQGPGPILISRISPPSVPRRDQSFGYNEDSGGHLFPLPAPFPTRSGTHGDTVGPGDYDPQDLNQWACSVGTKIVEGQRKTVFEAEWGPKAPRPGPGDYNPKIRPRYQLETQGSSSFMSGVPKGGSTKPAVGPGPGQYAPDKALNTVSTSSGVQCFGSTAQRSAWLRSEKTPFNEREAGDVPGPGAYGGVLADTSFKCKVSKSLTDEKIGFSSTESRSFLGSKVGDPEGLPGPGQYDLNMQSIMGSIQQKSRVGLKGVFGSTGDRFRDGGAAREDMDRSPMHTWDQGKVTKRVMVLHQSPNPLCSFKSVTKRFEREPPGTSPPPKIYHIKDSFDKIVEKKVHGISKPFMSTTRRFDRGVFDSPGSFDEPGPGSYNIGRAKTAKPPPRSRAQITSRLPQDVRFRVSSERISSLGPGSHEIPTSSLEKKSYNITYGKLGRRRTHRELRTTQVPMAYPMSAVSPNSGAPRTAISVA